MKSLLHIAVLLLIVVFSTSCIDEVEFDVDATATEVTIEGQLSDSLMLHSVRISNSVVFGQDSGLVSTPISGAEVVMISDEPAEYKFDELSTGVYSWYGAGTPGHTYHIRVELNNGEAYESDKHEMQEPTDIGTLSSGLFNLEFLNSNNTISEVTRVGLYVTSELASNSAPTYAMFRVSGEFEFEEFYPGIMNIRKCYVRENIDFDVISVFDGNELPDNEIREERILATNYNWRFFYNYCFHVEQYTIDEATYNYWARVKELTSADQTVFTPPPGKIRGNMRNVNNPDDKVLGFFTVASRDKSEEFINVSDVDEVVLPRCMDPDLVSFFFRPQECFDCLNFDQSTRTKPDYWP